MRKPWLYSLLNWLAVALILRVLVAILSNYPDYFPPDFDSLFLQGREATFRGIYPIAFYIHIFAAPVVLVNGLILMSERFRRRSWRWHRILGRLQVILILLLVAPSSLIMALHAFGGWPAGFSFICLSLCTGWCAVLGTYFARQRKIAAHRLWMNRCFLLLCSAIFLRLTSGAISLLEVSDPEQAYIFASWSSWLIPLGVYELARK
jgi:uncharacterized membrane protein